MSFKIDFTDVTMIGTALNDTVNLGWINEINRMDTSPAEAVILDIKLVGVTFEFEEEDRQENIRAISDLSSVDFAIRRVGSTGLDVAAYSDGSCIGSVGWIPKEIARPLSKIFGDLEIFASRYQVASRHISVEVPSFVDMDVDSMSDDDFNGFIDGFSKKMVFGIKIRFIIRSLLNPLLDISRLLIGGKKMSKEEQEKKTDNEEKETPKEPLEVEHQEKQNSDRELLVEG